MSWVSATVRPRYDVPGNTRGGLRFQKDHAEPVNDDVQHTRRTTLSDHLSYAGESAHEVVGVRSSVSEEIEVFRITMTELQGEARTAGEGPTLKQPGGAQTSLDGPA